MFTKTWKEGSPEDQLGPRWKGLYQVILATPQLLESIKGKVSTPPGHHTPLEKTWTSEPVEYLKFLFKKHQKIRECHHTEAKIDRKLELLFSDSHVDRVPM